MIMSYVGCNIDRNREISFPKILFYQALDESSMKVLPFERKMANF